MGILRFSKILSQNYSSFIDFQVILSIMAQSVFVVEPSAWPCWKGIFIENLKKQEK
jgi:hypothetical protein